MAIFTTDRNIMAILHNKISMHDISINNKKTKQAKFYLTNNNINKLDNISQYYNISKSLLLNDLIEIL